MLQVPQVGTQIKGYELRELIGEGGFGVVYRAFQPSVGREVAVKIIQPMFANQTDFIRKFETEAQIVARLEHFHIVPLYDYWRDPDGAYFVMRLMRGGTLRQLLKQGRVPDVNLLRMLEQIGAALAAAHRNNVVHRDLKPDNIMFDSDGNAYLADFGIAKLLEVNARGEEEVMESNRALVGSPAYASPEQIRSMPITPASDVYSLGVMLYEMLTGVHPYQGASLHTLLFKHLQDPLPTLQRYREELPESLDNVLAHATQKEPQDRYESIQEFIQHFKQVFLAYTAENPLPTPEIRSTTNYDVTPTRRQTIEMEMGWSEIANPYKGLRAFEEADAAHFFGRSVLVDHLLTHFREQNQRFLALVGPSGSGKSSVVQAGIIPALRRDAIPNSRNWFIVEMTPGATPLDELEAALLGIASMPIMNLRELLKSPDGLSEALSYILPKGAELLLYIDQFEEAFTFVENERERAHLLALLLHAVQDPLSRLRVIVTLRADFYDRPLLYPEFGEMFRRHTEVVLPMSETELAESITGPAEQVRLYLEAGLVQAIINDVKDQPGALPLLQYALTELFERRDGPQLTLQSYNNIGGAMGALARRADEIYLQLDAQGKAATKQLFLRLVTLGEGTEDTRRRVLRSELLSISSGTDKRIMERTIALYSRYRLLTLDRDAATREPTVEIAHEALIREWSKLRDWLNSGREDLRMERRILQSAEDWRKYQKDASYLATGAQLAAFSEWLKSTDLRLTELENAYLQASQAQHEAQIAAEQARAQREATLEQRSRNVRRALVVVMAVALVMALGLSAWALNERTIAQASAIRADLAAEQARSASLSAQAQIALFNHDTDLATALVLAANSIDNPPTVAQQMLFQIAYLPATRSLAAPTGTDVNALAWMQSESAVIFATREGSVGKWNPLTQETQMFGASEGIVINTLTMHPNEQELLIGRLNGTVVRYDISSGDVLGRYTVSDSAVSVSALLYAPQTDASFAWVGLQSGGIVPLDLTSGALGQPLGAQGTQHSGNITRLRLHPNGELLVSASVDNTVRLWDVRSGELVRQLNEHTAPVRDVAVSTDGTSLVSVAQNGRLVQYSLADFSPIQQITREDLRFWSVTFDANNTPITGEQNGDLRLWIPNNPQALLLRGHRGSVNQIIKARSLGYNSVVSASADGTMRVWTLANRQADFIVQDPISTRGGVFALDTHGDILLSAGTFGSLEAWNINTGERDLAVDARLITNETTYTQASFIRDGRHIVTTSNDGRIDVWDFETGENIERIRRHRGSILALAVHPDEQVIATSSVDQTLRIWDLNTYEEILTPIEREGVVSALAYSPNGAQLLVGFSDGSLRMLNTNDYSELWRIENAHANSIGALAFNESGSLFASGSQDNTAQVFETASATPVQRLVGHADAVLAVKFAPHGLGLLTASGNAFGVDTDRSIRLWDIESGQELRRFGAEHREHINALALTEDGSALISADGDRYIIRYSLPTNAALLSFVRANRYARPLTCNEQVSFGIVSQRCDPTPTP